MARKIVNADDFKRSARAHLPRMMFDYLEGGALDEITVAANEHRFQEILLKQRIYKDVSNISLSTTAQGHALDFPLMVSPMGLLGIFHPQADNAVARAAAEAGCIFIHSAWSSLPLEEVVSAAPDSTWSQVQFWADDSLTQDHIARAKKCGRDVLVVTGDVAVSSKRERDLRHGLSFPPRPPVRDIIESAAHPGWLLGMLRAPKMTWGNYKDNGRPIPLKDMGDFMYGNQDQSVSWERFARLRESWKGKLVVKGVMAAEDADRAVAEGADGIIVSNHGGRQFDAQPATIQVLPHIVEAVGGRCEVYLDGGVRRGSDLVKAIALGARAALIGRPAAYALTVNGQEGVEELFEILSSEFRVTMGFVGKNSVAEIDESVVFRPDEPTPEHGQNPALPRKRKIHEFEYRIPAS